MKKLIAALACLALLGGLAFAQVGQQVVTTLTGSQYIGVQGGTLPAVISATNLLKYARTGAGTATALGATGTVSLDPTKGSVFTVTPTGAITLNAASAPVGAVAYLVVTTSGVSSFNITPTTNFKSTGALATGTVSGKVFVITFVGDGTNMNEVARTAAM